MQNILKYQIADFNIAMNCRSVYMRKLCGAYLGSYDSCADIDLCYSSEERELYQRPDMHLSEFEYAYTFSRFIRELVKRDAFCFHASALSVDGEGILFSADSGMGKSTHARLWKRFMEGHEVVHLNDDKPVIRFLDGKAWVCGTPWSGKHSLHANRKALVRALVFLEQAQENQIVRVPQEHAFPLVFRQVLGGKADQEQVAELMGLLDRFIRGVPVYRLQCNISREAVELVYQTLYGGEHED